MIGPEKPVSYPIPLPFHQRRKKKQQRKSPLIQPKVSSSSSKATCVSNKETTHRVDRVKRYSPDRHPRFLPAEKHAEKQKQTINAAKKKKKEKKKEEQNKSPLIQSRNTDRYLVGNRHAFPTKYPMLGQSENTFPRSSSQISPCRKTCRKNLHIS
jgi:hypothetical protein